MENPSLDVRVLSILGHSLASYGALAAGFFLLWLLSGKLALIQSPSIGAWEGVAEKLTLVASRDSEPTTKIKVPGSAGPAPAPKEAAAKAKADIAMREPTLKDDPPPKKPEPPPETEPDVDIGPPWVIVDAGHGGGDGGSVHNGIIEKTLALDIAKRVETHLKKAGLRVKMTRDKDVYVDLEERSEIANKTGAAAFVSVHLNANLTSSVNGLEVYFSPQKTLRAKRLLQAALKLDHIQGLQDGRSERLATAIQKYACELSGARNRGIREKGYTVVIGSAMPAVLVECGFISNPAEAKKIKLSSYREKLGQGIAKGITTYLQAQAADPMRDIVRAKPKIEPPPPEEWHGPPSPFEVGPPRPLDLKPAGDKELKLPKDTAPDKALPNAA